MGLAETDFQKLYDEQIVGYITTENAIAALVYTGLSFKPPLAMAYLCLNSVE